MVPVGQFATVLNIGIGDGIYNGPNDSGANVFGSAAFYFTQQISLLAEYTGRFTNAALSVAPFRSFPLTVTLGATNLGERSEEHTSELQSLMRISYAVFCLKKKTQQLI